MNVPRDFGTRVADLRVRAGLHQRELATKLHVTRLAVINWENGRAFPGFWSLLEIARFFNVSLDWLAGHNATHGGMK